VLPKPPSWTSGISFQAEGGNSGRREREERGGRGGINIPIVVSKTWQHYKRSSEQLNCTQFVQLILRKIIKIVATRCHILRLECTKFDFGWGSVPDPIGGAYSAPPDPLAEFKGSYF